MLARADPERWQTVLLANSIVQETRETIADCHKETEESATPRRCAIMIPLEDDRQNPDRR